MADDGSREGGLNDAELVEVVPLVRLVTCRYVEFEDLD
jgi:hypothetical protein